MNPVAGRGKGARQWPALERELRELFDDLTVRHTARRGDAEEFAREWAHDRAGSTVVAIGGDGTVHEVVNGLLSNADTARLGIIPTGTGNDFASTTGIAAPASSVLARFGEPPRRFDAGRIRFTDRSGTSRTRIFLNSTSVGVVPHANRLSGRLKKLMPGRLPYSLGGVGALAAAGTAHYSMYSGSQTIYQGQALNITIANGARFGGGMRISPGSVADDGILDQVVIGDIGKWRALVALSRLYAGTHIGMPGISVTPATGPIRIVRTDGNLLIEADGEEFAAGPELEIEVLPGALLLVN